jgi:(p)ppGpp synthase/HD superfamily hydrolase
MAHTLRSSSAQSFFAAKHYDHAKDLIKPVFAHGVRVGMMVFSKTKSLEAAQAGILHDIIEDTEVTTEMLSKYFSDNVALLVQACSVDPSIADQEKALRLVIRNVAQHGEEALMIKVADIYDNLHYYQSLGDQKGIDYCLIQCQILQEEQLTFPSIKSNQSVQDLLSFAGV